MSDSGPLSPLLPLVAYVDELCRGARVLLVGSAASAGLAAAVIERGARLVHVCDRDAGRRAEAQARSNVAAVTFGALDDGGAALREGFFDLALVENLAAEPDARASLRLVARLLSARGAVLVAAPNPEGARFLLADRAAPSLDYYALYDAVVAAFPSVRMLGQVPFVGYALVDFAVEGEPSPVIDTSLVPAAGEEPDYFVALAARQHRALDSYAVVQLPVRERFASPAPTAPPVPVPAVAPVPPVEEPTPAAVVSQEKSSGPPKAAAAENELRRELARQEAWIAELEARAAAADARADAAEGELDELRERLANGEQRARTELENIERERAVARVELERMRRLVHEANERIEHGAAELPARLESQQTSLRAELGAREAALRAELATRETALRAEHAAREAALRAELAQKQAELDGSNADDAHAGEVARVEAQLAERGHEIRRLERELREVERTGRELVRKLAAPFTAGLSAAAAPSAVAAPAVATNGSDAPIPASPSPVESEQATIRLVERLARAEADLVTLGWTRELLEQELLAARRDRSPADRVDRG